MEQLSIAKGSVAQFGFDLKVPFKAKPKLIYIMCAPQFQGKRVPDLGSAEPKGPLVLSCPGLR